MNTVAIMGRLTKDVELKTTQSGKSWVKFSIAVPVGKGKAEFFDCFAWETTAEFISKYFQKGSMIAIEGHLKQNSYKNKDGGVTNKIEICADKLSFCGGKKDDALKDTDEPEIESEPEFDDLPF